jgi:RNase H-fold protein (predicted Holliday junction resolvase)
LGITAQGLPNLVRVRKRTDLAALEQLIRERQVGLILMGNPINMRATRAGNPAGCASSPKRSESAPVFP